MGAAVISAYDVSKSFRVYDVGTGKGVLGAFKRRYYSKQALRGVSFDIGEGEIVALLGENGAGKSTLIKTLTGIIYPDRGTVSVLGMEPHAERVGLMKRIGVVFGAHPQLYPSLPPIDTFNYMRVMFGIPQKDFDRRLDYFLGIMNLRDVYRRQVRLLSLGERMKCNVVASLLHMPKVVIMDEPLIGVDAVSAFALRKALLDMRERHRTTFLISTHITADVELLAERVLLIDDGRLLFNGSKDQLKRMFGNKKQLRLQFGGRPAVNLAKYGKVLEQKENFARIEIDAKAEKSRRVLGLLADKDLLNYSVTDPGLGYILGKLYSRSRRSRSGK